MVNLLDSVVFVNFSASSGIAFLNAVVSKRLLDTFVHLTLNTSIIISSVFLAVISALISSSMAVMSAASSSIIALSSFSSLTFAVNSFVDITFADSITPAGYFAPMSFASNAPDYSDKLSQIQNNHNETKVEQNFEITIPIEKVEDYNDFVTKLRDDPKFEKMIQSMTIGRINGGSPNAKYSYSWKNK